MALMTRRTRTARPAVLLALSLGLLGGCQGDVPNADVEDRKVVTSGKQETALEAVPEAVLAAAQAAKPDLEISMAEYERRDGREYYDIGGTLPDGSELELDMMLGDPGWIVVEIQRDITMDLTPAVVGAALAAHSPDWRPDRIIESDQGDGVIIYEFFGPGNGDEPLKIEVKLEGEEAQVLADEWAH